MPILILPEDNPVSVNVELETEPLQRLWVGTGGRYEALQRPAQQPGGQPLELAVAQEAVTADVAESETMRRKGHVRCDCTEGTPPHLCLE